MDGLTSSGTVAAVQPQCDTLAANILETAKTRGWKIAAAESLTAGLLADAFVRIPGASEVFLGSAVTYDINAKASVLGVDADLLRAEGAVHPEVARQMAERTAYLYDQPQYEGHVLGLSTTGVAGPGPDGNKPAGLVYIGVSIPAGALADTRKTVAVKLRLSGSREEVRHLSVLNVLRFVTQFTASKKE
ncbi:nicotinamide-nucleotide amidohydrolase family protein [Bifidobacterium sp. ESL0682]|uniref:CinA family protein n=1 Tax=Bifidobacterium sp. ESL0682 TaxID=2983212 RepID=UPI0023F73BC9|nr:nicotinamide-nucleotide amidohydrolase family protein [Bifidobacterium sp. ESL0682]WEV42744.1 nicotinamide-nucleotide amidohydrolase family protein [Bifidobacterium sp. ESL0682]